MSENPYSAQSMQRPAQASDFGSQMPSGPARTSVLAILSLLFSLVCFIPGLSTIGSVLGVFAIIGISRSRGRVKGVGLAVAGIVIGLLVTIIWIGLAIGINQGLQQYATLGSIVADVQDGDEPAVRSRLASATNERLTSADIAAFEAAYQADAGAYEGVPTGIGPLFSSFSELGQAGGQPDPSRVPYTNPVPLPGSFENGTRLMWIALSTSEKDSSGLGPAFVNIGIELSDGTIAWLIDPQTLGSGSAPIAPLEAGDTEAEPGEQPETAPDEATDEGTVEGTDGETGGGTDGTGG